MREICSSDIKIESDLDGYTEEEIKEFSNELDYLLVSDSDDIELSEEEYLDIKRIQKLLGTKFGGAYAERVIYENAIKQVDNLFYLRDAELTDEKKIAAIDNCISLLRQGIPVDQVSFQAIPPPVEYEYKWLAIEGFPQELERKNLNFSDLEEYIERKFTEQEKSDAIDYVSELYTCYNKASNYAHKFY